MPGYFKVGKPCFTKVTEEYKEESKRDDAEKEPTNSEEEAIKKKAQRKEKKNTRTASLAVPCSSHCLPVPRLFAPLPGSSALPSLSAFSVRIPRLSALSASSVPMFGFSTPPSPSGCLPMSGLSAPPSEPSALPSPSASVVCVLRLSAPSAFGTLVPGSFTSSSPSYRLPMSGLSILSLSSCLLVPGLSPLFPN